jgi:filamentous hemagglutinin family protein
MDSINTELNGSIELVGGNAEVIFINPFGIILD